MSRNIGIRQPSGGLSALLAARIIGVSFLWGIGATIFWIVGAFLLFGDPGVLNPLVLAFTFWGAILGLVAAGSHLLASFAVGKVLPGLPRDILSAAIGWGVALALWFALFLAGMDITMVIGSVIGAGVGAILNFSAVRIHPPSGA